MKFSQTLTQSTRSPLACLHRSPRLEIWFSEFVGRICEMVMVGNGPQCPLTRLVPSVDRRPRAIPHPRKREKGPPTISTTSNISNRRLSAWGTTRNTIKSRQPRNFSVTINSLCATSSSYIRPQKCAPGLGSAIRCHSGSGHCRA